MSGKKKIPKTEKPDAETEKSKEVEVPKTKKEEWLELVNPTLLTRRNYLWSLDKFCEFTDMTPDELIEEADGDVRNGVLPRDRKLKRRLIDFRTSLIERGLAPNTLHNYMSGALSFYKAFDHEIPNLGKRAKPRPKAEHLDIPNKEDVREALKVCDDRDKAIILVGCSSGLSIASIVDLTVEQFINGYDPETDTCTLFLRREKSQTDFITFLNPEACTAVHDYLAQRNRTLDYSDSRKEISLGKQRWEAQGKNGKKQYLFIKKLVTDKYLTTKDEELRKLDTKGLLKAYNEIADKAKKSNGKGIWNLVRSHNMRKYFNSTLKNAGMDSERVEFMMGHNLGGTKSAYYRADVTKLRELYTQYMHHLTIEKALDIAASPEYRKIEAENKTLVAETVKHMVERDELAEMKREMQRMRLDWEVMMATATGGGNRTIADDLKLDKLEWSEVEKAIDTVNTSVGMESDDLTQYKVAGKSDLIRFYKSLEGEQGKVKHLPGAKNHAAKPSRKQKQAH